MARWPGPGRVLSRPWPFAALAIVTAAILAATLSPDPSVQGTARLDLDLEAPRSVADAIANVLLFVPFGLAAAAALGRPRLAVLAGLLLSAAIEVVQLLVPGRFTSPSDLVFNTLGATLGVLLLARAELWLRPPPGARRMLSTGSLLFGLLVLVGGARLLEPSFPDGPLWGQWTPDRSPAGPYAGAVLRAHTSGAAVGSGPLQDPGPVRRALRDGERVAVEFVAGPPVAWRQPILSIASEHDVLLTLAADRADLVLAFRMRAADLGLDQPELRLEGALAGAGGARVAAGAWREGDLWCLEANDVARCGLGFSPVDTWGLLLFPVPRALAPAVPVAWLIVLLGPAGFWARTTGRAAVAGGAAAAVLAWLPGGVGVHGARPEQVAGAVAAVMAGYALQRLLDARVRRRGRGAGLAAEARVC